MKHHRNPRPPAINGLPATFIEAEEDLIIRTVRKWWELKGDLFTAESCHADFEAQFLNVLTHPEDAKSVSLVVQVARFGHPAADHALFSFADAAMNAHRFPELPLCVQEYVRENMRRGELPTTYPPRTPQTAVHYGRDIAICFCMDRVRVRYPNVPPYKAKKHRRSAADLVSEAFGVLEERQAARIHQSYGKLAEKLAEFFLWPVRIENGDPLAWIEKW